MRAWASAIVGVMLVAAGFFLGAKSEPVERETAEAANEVERTRKTPQRRKHLPNASILALTGGISTLGERVARLERERSGEDSSERAEDAPRAADELRDTLAKRKAERLARWADAERAFAEEARDSNWAAEKERELSAFYESAAIANTTVTGRECKATFCRIAVRHATGDTLQHFEETWQRMPENVVLQTGEPDGQGAVESVVYIVRAGRERENALYGALGLRKRAP